MAERTRVGSVKKTVEAELQIKLKQMEIEAQRELERMRIEKELQLKDRELKGKQIEAEKEIELAKIEREGKVQRNNNPNFEAVKYAKLIPKFEERNIDQYFAQFEITALNYNFPENLWPMMLQPALTGRAAEVFTSLTREQQKEYQVVKSLILKAYELVPEAYRRKFRDLKKKNEQTHVEFLREKERFLEKWLTSKEVGTSYERLKSLVLMEEFQSCVRQDVRTHLADRGEDDVHKVAVLADDYTISHQFAEMPTVKRENEPANPGTSLRGQATYKNESSIRECSYCKKQGHTQDDCWRLKPRRDKWESKVVACATSYPTRIYRPTPVNTHRQLMPLSVGQPESTKDRRATQCSIMEETEVKGFMEVSKDITESLRKEGLRVASTPSAKLRKTPWEEFGPFISQGFVSLPGESTTLRPIRILRDTGAVQSLILDGVLPLSGSTETGDCTLIHGIGQGVNRVTLHHINIKSDLFSGPAIVGVQSEFPVEGISLLLGNDLAGTKVFAHPSSTLVSDLTTPPDIDLELNTVGAVTRAMSSKISKKTTSVGRGDATEVELADTFLATLYQQNVDGDKPTREHLIEEQIKDVETSELRDNALPLEETEQDPCVYYLNEGILMRRWRPPEASGDEEWRILHQIVVPTKFRRDILTLAHDTPLSGHLGVKKTYQRIASHFFWPHLKKDVAEYCRTCHVCQLVGKPNQTIPPAPLHPVPAFDEPFSRIIIDCVGPLPKTKSGHQYLLTIMCAATRFPEAVPLRNITTASIVKALIKFFTTFGLPREVQSDQGTNFTATLFKQVMKQLGIKQCLSSAYHPESQGALERFHQTLKNMIRTYCHDHGRDWDEGIPMLLFASREAVQDSLGFSPFELVFGHTVRGPLKSLKEAWMSSTPTDGLLDYVLRFKNQLFEACRLARTHLKQAQHKMKTWYDRKAKARSFSPGDEVLVFLPIPGQTLQARYFGPYEVESKNDDLNYVIKTPDRKKKRQLCHVNMLKEYFKREKNQPATVKTVAMIHVNHTEDEIHTEKVGQYKLKNSEILSNLPLKLSHLPPDQQQVVTSVIMDFAMLFPDVPNKTKLIVHDVEIGTAASVKQHPYRVNPAKLEIMRAEVKYMLENDIIEHSKSNWSSPCVLVPKSDGSYRFCTDFRKVNAVTKTDSFPIPRIDDLIDRMGNARYVTKIDMLAGYWQIPLSGRAMEISAFATPDGLYQYKVMPFGMKNAPATFQRLINSLIADLENSSAYIDDIIVYSHDFMSHVKQIKALFRKLAQAGLTVNLNKSEFCHATVEYLGHVVGQGQVKPIAAKVEAIQVISPPNDRKQLMRFLGMAGYYRKFCANFSVIAAPLTNLLKKEAKFIWSPECEEAFGKIKAMLTGSPVLVTPDFKRQFQLAVDASDAGVGAVLSQIDEENIDHPICYFSKKFNKHQVNYSTIEKECLGIVLALQQFDFYVSCSAHPVLVLTDHNPLTFLSRMSTKN